MTAPRAWGVALFLAAVTVIVSGVVSIMQVRLRAERVGQEIRTHERESIRLRKRFLKEHERKRASREAEAG